MLAYVRGLMEWVVRRFMKWEHFAVCSIWYFSAVGAPIAAMCGCIGRVEACWRRRSCRERFFISP